jgi:hypothetical protein
MFIRIAGITSNIHESKHCHKDTEKCCEVKEQKVVKLKNKWVMKMKQKKVQKKTVEHQLNN